MERRSAQHLGYVDASHRGAAPLGAPSRRFPQDRWPEDSFRSASSAPGRAFRECGLLLQPGPTDIPHSRVRGIHTSSEGPHIPVSQLLAGGRSTSGRSPDAARVRLLRRAARGRRTKRAQGIAPRRPPEPWKRISASTLRPAPPQDASWSAPLRAGWRQYGYDPIL